MSKVFGVTGWKNSGKTTMAAAMVSEFSNRGLVVSTVKHAHSQFSIDQEGTDSHRHRLAGAREAAIVSDARWAIIHEVRSGGAAPTLKTILDKLAPCDLVIVEGFKNSEIPKIECIRSQSATSDPVWKSNNTIRAVAADHEIIDCPLPQFKLDDVSGVADYIAQLTGLGL